jgi:hypothetical protein
MRVLVASTPNLGERSNVANAASELLIEVWARTDDPPAPRSVSPGSSSTPGHPSPAAGGYTAVQYRPTPFPDTEEGRT